MIVFDANSGRKVLSKDGPANRFGPRRSRTAARFRNASKLPVAFIRFESKKNAAPLVQVRSPFRPLSISSQVILVTIGATPNCDM